MEQDEHKTLDSLCRYMTDVNGRGETWRVVALDGCIKVVADFPPGPVDDACARITGWIVTRGLDEPSVLANLVHGAKLGRGSELDVPLLRGLGEPVSTEEVRLRLAAFGY